MTEAEAEERGGGEREAEADVTRIVEGSRGGGGG